METLPQPLEPRRHVSADWSADYSRPPGQRIVVVLIIMLGVFGLGMLAGMRTAQHVGLGPTAAQIAVKAVDGWQRVVHDP